LLDAARIPNTKRQEGKRLGNKEDKQKMSRSKERWKVKIASLYYAQPHVTRAPLRHLDCLVRSFFLSLSICWKDHRMEAFTFAVSTQVDFPIHVKMYVPL
jgi:hypothetical protein